MQQMTPRSAKPENDPAPVDDDEIDVRALARQTVKNARTAHRESRRAAAEDETPGMKRRYVAEGVPQAVIDTAVRQMEDAGMKVDLRRIKKLNEGRWEVDLS